MLRVPSILIALAVGPAQAEQQPLQPSQKWVAEYTESMCVLSRTYGSGQDSIILALRYLPLSTDTELVLIQPNEGAKSSRSGDLVVTLPESGKTIEAKYWSRYDQELGKRIASADVELDQDALKRAKSISLKYGTAAAVVLALKGTEAALGILDHCANILLKSWDIDPDYKKAIAEDASPLGKPPSSWISFHDYPPEALRDGLQGTASIVWRINTLGRVENCRVVRSSGHDSLDRASCALIRKRAVYNPAIGTDGKPVVSYSARRVRWMLI